MRGATAPISPSIPKQFFPEWCRPLQAADEIKITKDPLRVIELLRCALA
jgi:hypothetical protein